MEQPAFQYKQHLHPLLMPCRLGTGAEMGTTTRAWSQLLWGALVLLSFPALSYLWETISTSQA